MKKISDFVGLYPLSKTLCFELKPIGNTLENIYKKDIISHDIKRNEDYKLIKTEMDNYHKLFISEVLGSISPNETSLKLLDSYFLLAQKNVKDEKEDKLFDSIKEELRKFIVSKFYNNANFKSLFGKKIIDELLPKQFSDKAELFKRFDKFSTYFTGFFENRKNMYSDEEKSTSIAYRLINENLPIYCGNIISFEKIKNSEIAINFKKIENDFDLGIFSLNDIFSLKNYFRTITQEQIDIYNSVIGGFTLEDGIKIQGLNEYINLYNQQHKDSRLPLLKPLYKMILSDRVRLSWLDEGFSSDEDMISAITEFCNGIREYIFGPDGLKSLLLNIDNYKTGNIFIANNLCLTNISQKIFGNYDVITNAIKNNLKKEITPTIKEKKNPEIFEERINKEFKLYKSFSIDYLNSVTGSDKVIQEYFGKLGETDNGLKQNIDLFSNIEINYSNVSAVLEGKYKDINQSDEAIELIKKLLDSYKSLQHFIEPLKGSGNELEKDTQFDILFSDIWNKLDEVTLLYDRVRNWLTRKPYSTEKIKLNFENSTLLNGWDVNKETDNTSVILRKNDNYYLGIMDKQYNHIFEETLPSEGDCYEKMVYKLLPGPNKMLPKVFFSKSRIDEFAPSDTLRNAYLKGTHKKSCPNFNIDDCRQLIDFFKSSISKHEDWSRFNFNFTDTYKYEGIDDFYREVEQQGYMISFQPISEYYINKLVEDGKLYLFQIWNKDFSKYSKGAPNLHTLYWKALFDERNLKDVVYKLNGQAEIFYRKSSIVRSNIVVHKANRPILNKNENNSKKESCFDYDIIKDRRYTLDKFQFHVPITMNFKSNDRNNNSINENVFDLIKSGGVEHIIGIDRGERHLLYLTLINLKGQIVKQMTLNNIECKFGDVNYKQLLSSREGDRLESRKNWKKIDNIKDLKEGYLSQVVYLISKMMVDYKAIVVLEDLNMGFMKGRQKIERNVYEQFEKKLIDKLNYLVFKQQDPNGAGGVYNALQLTKKFESFKKLGKQSGLLFYIPAWNTSKIDPVTGFINMFDTRYESVDKARSFFEKFDSIKYNSDKDWFEFAFDYKNFTSKLTDTKTKWTLCTYGTRIKTFRNPDKLNQWDNEEVDLTQEFKDVFKELDIDIKGNLKNIICNITDKKYLERMMYLMKLLVQLRNSVSNSEIDYLLSPVCENGVFYDSRVCDSTLPQDADANGAYNIARKGLMLINRIQDCKNNKPDLKITNSDWLQFVQKKSL